jgi:hypothetical protein
MGTKMMSFCRLRRQTALSSGSIKYQQTPKIDAPARVRKKSDILAELRRLVADNTLTDEAFRAKAGMLLLPDQSSAPRSRAADVREVLSRNARRIRPILQLLVKLNLLGNGVGGDGLSWLDGIYHDEVDKFFIDKAPAWAPRWKMLIEESDTQGSLRAYEAATAWAVRQGLRNGSLYSKYGFEYSDPARQLMPPDIWEQRRSSCQHEKDLPTADHLYIERAQAASSSIARRASRGHRRWRGVDRTQGPIFSSRRGGSATGGRGAGSKRTVSQGRADPAADAATGVGCSGAFQLEAVGSGTQERRRIARRVWGVARGGHRSGVPRRGDHDPRRSRK